MVELSVLIPAIRTPLWKKMYDSLVKSCNEHEFELLLISPFDLPIELQSVNNIKLIKEHSCPSRAAMVGSFECDGKYIFHCVDDAVFQPNAVSRAVNLYKKECSFKDVINMRYTEGVGYNGEPLPLEYWNAHFHRELRNLPGVDVSYKISLHHLLDIEYFREIGGYDCQFEYLNHGLHDFVFRIQEDGGRILDSEDLISICDHLPGHAGDHGPIHDAQIFHDYPLFLSIYGKPGKPASNRIKLDLNGWSQQPSVWNRRFKNKIPKSYSELFNV